MRRRSPAQIWQDHQRRCPWCACGEEHRCTFGLGLKLTAEGTPLPVVQSSTVFVGRRMLRHGRYPIAPRHWVQFQRLVHEVSVEGLPLPPRLDVASLGPAFHWGATCASTHQLALALLCYLWRDPRLAMEHAPTLAQGLLRSLQDDQWHLRPDEILATLPNAPPPLGRTHEMPARPCRPRAAIPSGAVKGAASGLLAGE